MGRGPLCGDPCHLHTALLITPRGTPAGASWCLTADATLGLRADVQAVPLLLRWLPLSAQLLGADQAPPGALISIADGITAPACNRRWPAPPTLALGQIKAWANTATSRVGLEGERGAMSGVVDLAGPSAWLQVETGRQTAASELYGALAVTSGLLLSVLGRALVHAACVCLPRVGGILVVGDARAGKTTTALNLASTGGALVSDDQVVLKMGASGCMVEGWPRTLHVDRGWPGGGPTGVREERLPQDLGIELQREAQLAGLVFPVVRAGQSTTALRIVPADAFARLVRQSPWLFVRHQATRQVQATLEQAAESPSVELQLGRDSFGDGAVARGLILEAVTNP